MKIACVAFKYFEFGGLQRDMISISRALTQAGHDVQVWVGAQDDPTPEGVTMHCVHAKGLTNAQRDADCHQKIQHALQANPVDCVLGFNKMPGLDFYYAADSCFASRFGRFSLKKHLPRYQHYLHFEEAVFGPTQTTHAFIISAEEGKRYRAAYKTDHTRMTLLPPGIQRNRQAPPGRMAHRQTIRNEWGVADEDCILLMVGSGFRTKGLDRSIMALASLPPADLANTQLFVVGADNPKPYQSLIKRLKLNDRVHFFGGRSDVMDFFMGADVLLHPAYRENTGTVLLEAMIAGCPVIASAACGYAHFIESANGGVVIPEPFDQVQFNGAVQTLVQDHSKRQTYSDQGILFGQTGDIYQRDDRVVREIEARMHRSKTL